MNDLSSEQIDRLWDEARDGALDGERQAAFDRAVSKDPQRAALWAEESRWLDMLRDDEAVQDTGFSAGVVQRWRSERRGPVIGRIAAVLATSAAAALIAVGVWVGSNPGAPAIDGGDVVGPVAVTPQADPVGALMREVDQTVAQQPAKIRQVVADTVKLLDVDQYLSRLGAPVPDPRDYLDPAKSKG